MILPVTIQSGWSWPDHKIGRVGPFEASGSLYTVLVNKTTNKLGVFKSTNSGETWAEQNSAGAPSILATTNYKTCDAILSTSTVISVVYPLVTTGTMTIKQFNTATDLWGTASAAGIDLDGLVGGGLDTSGKCPLYLVARSDGSYVVYYHGAVEVISMTNYRRPAYARLSAIGGIWTSGVAVSPTGSATGYECLGAVLGSSDRTHFFYRLMTSSASPSHRSLTSANVLNTAANTGGTAVSSTAVYPATHLFRRDAGGGAIEIGIGYVFTASSSLLLLQRATSADSPTWSSVQSIVTTTGTASVESANSNPGSFATDGTEVFAFWINDASQFIYYDRDSGTSTWGTDTLFLGTPANQVSQLTSSLAQNVGRVTSGFQVAQSFTVAGITIVNAVTLYPSKVGSPTDGLVVDIVSSLGGTPLATSSVVSNTSVNVLGTQFDFPTPVTLTSGNTYYLVVSRSSTTSDTNYYNLDYTGTDVYANGTLWLNNTGSTGGTWTQIIGSDLKFVIPSSPLVIGISAQKVTNGYGFAYEDNGIVKYTALLSVTVTASYATATVSSPAAIISGAGAGTPATITGAVATVTITSPAATLLLGALVPGAVGSSTASAPISTFLRGVIFSGIVGVITATAPASSIAISITVNAAVGIITISSPIATVAYGYVVSGSISTATLSSPAASFAMSYALLGAVSSISSSALATIFVYGSIVSGAVSIITTTIPISTLIFGSIVSAVPGTIVALSPIASIVISFPVVIDGAVSTVTIGIPIATLVFGSVVSGALGAITAVSLGSTFAISKTITGAVSSANVSSLISSFIYGFVVTIQPSIATVSALIISISGGAIISAIISSISILSPSGTFTYGSIVSSIVAIATIVSLAGIFTSASIVVITGIVISSTALAPISTFILGITVSISYITATISSLIIIFIYGSIVSIVNITAQISAPIATMSAGALVTGSLSQSIIESLAALITVTSVALMLPAPATILIEAPIANIITGAVFEGTTSDAVVESLPGLMTGGLVFEARPGTANIEILIIDFPLSADTVVFANIVYAEATGPIATFIAQRRKYFPGSIVRSHPAGQTSTVGINRSDDAIVGIEIAENAVVYSYVGTGTIVESP